MAAHQPLSSAGIARAAARIADEEGLEAVSMRRVAGDLGVSAMALYRHVAGRQELLLLMADAVKSNSLLPEGEQPWQEMLAHMAGSLWRTFTVHPWLLGIVLSPRRLVNLAAPADVERLLGALTTAGLDEDEGFDCLLGVSAAVIGTVTVAGAAAPGASSAGKEPVPTASAPAGSGQYAGEPGTQGTDGHPRANRFQHRSINDEVSRQSLDFLVANFIRGIESSRAQPPGSSREPVSRKENHAAEE
ncbi:TetR/AcrR family transcriptional regulator C-terminal domain-containing protein [Arthrobacter gandavensis]|uniref:TetR/AcrR family transcriptional regulator n=1 Tax=Arthrobacter gandavensis TaxID=169960 RepID=UPI00188F1EDD|nr:TetR/AcrR family transcriptional regulator C-terminal domain-containing protein [Arthrobacter gandavensis]MBF4995034.1 TetR/AcrR family transcriptional regulator C-terminal domain-containing protein [Arthrobacter gandavensis]